MSIPLATGTFDYISASCNQDFEKICGRLFGCFPPLSSINRALYAVQTFKSVFIAWEHNETKSLFDVNLKLSKRLCCALLSNALAMPCECNALLSGWATMVPYATQPIKPRLPMQLSELTVAALNHVQRRPFAKSPTALCKIKPRYPSIHPAY